MPTVPISHDKQAALSAAFVALREQGIIAKENFSCCGTCAVAELTDLAREAEGSGERIDGVAYYHGQDHDAIHETGSVYIGFAAFDSDDDQAIGRTVTQALRASGLEVVWSDSEADRILVDLSATASPDVA